MVETDSNARTWGMFCHLAALTGYLGVPLGWILGPLVVWLVKRNEIPFVEDEGKESLNFQITMTIVLAIAAVVAVLTCGIGLLLVIPLVIFHIVLTIVGAVQASNGEHYRYPFSIRFLY